MFRIRRKKNITENEFVKALEECKKVAKKEAALLGKKIEVFEDLLERSRSMFEMIIGQIDQDPDFKDEDLEKYLKSLFETIHEELHSGLERLQHSLTIKKQHLSHFTITLFGRTKAGKSTIREALTHGDGASIGRGGQRTTRDIKRYTWNNLQIIDTPGIAAYEGDEDVKIAESVIDESDLILFLITNDSFQSLEFEKLADLKAQNKPIVVLLNVKIDIANETRRKLFLRDHEKIVTHQGQAGNIARIQALAKEHFGHSSIEIIPIHAMSAFIASGETANGTREQLAAASRIGVLKAALEQLVTNQGIQKRTLTFRDDYIFYVRSIQAIYWDYFQKLRSRVTYLKRKRNDMVKWFDHYIQTSNKDIEHSIKNIYQPLHEDIDEFIDTYAGKKDAEAVWASKVTALNANKKIEELSVELIGDVKKYLEEFSRQIKFEFEHINFDMKGADIEDLQKGVIGRVARWGGAALGAGEGALIILAAANIWNPGGWVLTAVAIAGALVNVFGWLFGNDSKNFEKEKKKAKQLLFSQTEKMERKTIATVKTWFYDNITKGISKKLKQDLRRQLEIWDTLLENVEMKAREIDNLVELENISLFATLISQNGNPKDGTAERFISIARDQGHIAKILINDGVPQISAEGKERLEQIIGERIIFIPFTDDPIELFCRAIQPANVDPGSIAYNKNKKEYTVRVPFQKAGGIIGRKGVNIKMTAKLLKTKISVEKIS